MAALGVFDSQRDEGYSPLDFPPLAACAGRVETGRDRGGVHRAWSSRSGQPGDGLDAEWNSAGLAVQPAPKDIDRKVRMEP